MLSQKRTTLDHGKLFPFWEGERWQVLMATGRLFPFWEASDGEFLGDGCFWGFLFRKYYPTAGPGLHLGDVCLLLALRANGIRGKHRTCCGLVNDVIWSIFVSQVEVM
jgi:hypothetical protein